MEDITPHSWRRLDSQHDLPEKRYHSLSLVGTSLVVYGGGHEGVPVADLLVMKSIKSGWEKKTWSGAVSPPALWHHTAVEFGLRLYILGGSTASETNNEIFVYNQVTNVWIKARQLGDALPPPRCSHASAAIARLIYVFGGATAADKGQLLGDFWSYNTDTNFWTSLPTNGGPSARRGHTVTLAKNVLYVFGGRTQAGLSNEVFSWNHQTSTWTKHPCVGHVPPPTMGHCAFAVGRHIYILGGETTEGAQREVYALDTDNHAWHRMAQLSNVCCARRGHALTYNSNEHVAFVTGGFTEALGFSQPSFDTFARRIEVNITPPFVPPPEDAAITRAPTLASNIGRPKPTPDMPASLPGAATLVHRPVPSLSSSPAPSPTALRPALSSTDSAVLNKGRSPSTGGPSTVHLAAEPSRSSQSSDHGRDMRSSSPNPRPAGTPEPEKRPSQTGKTKGSRLNRPMPDTVDPVSPLSARGSGGGAGFFGSLKKKLNTADVLAGATPEAKAAAAAAAANDETSEVSNQEDGSVSKDSEKHVDDRSGGANSGGAAKDTLDSLPPETRQLLAELEAEAIIRALLPLSKDYFITKKLRTYHNVFSGGEAVSWLEKNLFVPRNAGVIYFQRLLDEGWFAHVPAERPFMDGSSHHYQLSDKALSLRPTVVAMTDEERQKQRDDERQAKKDVAKEAEDEKRRDKEHRDKERDDERDAKDKRKKEADDDKKKEEERRKEEERKKRRDKKEKAAAPEPEISITGPTAVIYSSKEAAPVPVAAPKPAPKQKEEEAVAETAEQIAKKDAHRQEVLKELIATEKDYIRDLGIIVNLYMTPLQNEQKDLIKPGEFQSVFSTINMLPPLNAELVGKLEKCKELPPAEQGVGSVFLEMHPYFKLYMGYCTNHAASLSTLKKLKSNAPFAAFIEEVRQKPECRKLDIEAYLIKPLQRICRYPLLLKEIHKDMPRQHKDRAALVDAIDKIEQVVREVNEAKRLAEHLNQVVEIQNSFVFPDAGTEIVTSSRRLIREAQVKKLTSGIMSETSDRIFFLFNDLLLIGTEKLGKNIGLGKKYQFKQMHPIETIIVWDVKDGDGGKHVKHAFTIVRTDKKDKQTYMVNTKEEKDQLVANINECIINIPNLGKDKKDTREVREAAFAAFKMGGTKPNQEFLMLKFLSEIPCSICKCNGPMEETRIQPFLSADSV